MTGFVPSSGPVDGNTLTDIVGVGFVNTGEIKVSFNGSVVAATYVSASVVRTSTPPGVSGNQPVQLALNGQQYVSSSVPFFYYGTPFLRLSAFVDDVLHIAAPSLLSTSPRSGPLTGGTPVTLVGTSFTYTTEALVRFVNSSSGTAYAVPTWNNNTQMNFTTPAVNQSGVYSLALAQNGLQYTPSLNFFYYCTLSDTRDLKFD